MFEIFTNIENVNLVLVAQMKEHGRPHVVVTGGAGYIGSVLVPLLLDDGYRVTVLDLFPRGANSLLGSLGRGVPGSLRLLKGDVRDPKAVDDAIGHESPAAIVHLAAIVGYPACERDPEQAWEINAEATSQLAARGHRMIYACTGSCYGAVPGGLCTEATPVSPLTDYGRSKAEGERAVLAAGGVSLRLATVFGLSPRLRFDLLVNDLTQRALKTGLLELYEPEFRRTFVHARDAARAFLMAIRHYDEMKGQAFNVGDENLNVSKRELAEKISGIVPCRITLRSDGTDLDKRNYAVSYAKLRALGYRAVVSLEDGIRELAITCPLLPSSDIEAARNV
ncbi:hypothetical protein LAZ67_23000213 [Cordylochernes scorpioides]|uniref:NAD-dependent epimerase/dehydratase domain-containing protein n=1 Tax=Cordylochernes scorpioides TaxID=51811 RepID=A0ABY6LSU9_9ARAC|nr:hypothetical protein LAZ67_23000213 [Cordylochernes scorpioides]